VGNTGVPSQSPGVWPVHPHVCGEYSCPAAASSAFWAVHPHVCGEYGCPLPVAGGLAGSPPRVWGIPCECSRLTLPCAVHPHVCGEYGTIDLVDIVHHRFTPTCVGNTASGWMVTLPKPVHPHVCGEYASSGATNSPATGSPPRVWGIRFTNGLVYAHHGSPPRVWGIRGGTGNHLSFNTVHPHVCGEYVWIRKQVRPTVGSPPRVWGIHLPAFPGLPANRFTPTCVGNTDGRYSPPSPSPVHPHVCGEYSSLCLKSLSSWRHLTTPTCVGNTLRQSLEIEIETVHPHVCREYLETET
jgi:hypothetical protein